jgi:putative oxidoreductase
MGRGRARDRRRAAAHDRPFWRCAALALAIYTLVLALLFHAYWLAPAAEARAQHGSFFNHISIIGGMLCVVAFGAGAYSLDALRGLQS